MKGTLYAKDGRPMCTVDVTELFQWPKELICHGSLDLEFPISPRTLRHSAHHLQLENGDTIHFCAGSFRCWHDSAFRRATYFAGPRRSLDGPPEPCPTGRVI